LTRQAPRPILTAQQRRPAHEARLCKQAGYIENYTEEISGDGPPVILLCRLGPLTWAGHEKLEELRTASC